jgi:hypothetical protein
MRTYQAVFNELSVEGVFGISLVENPAMEGLFVALNEDDKLKHHQIELKEIDKEQRILMGLVLEPNKPVYRNQNGEEFNIVFNEETIKNLSYHFFKAGHQKNSTIEHKDKINGVTFVESWLVEDSKKDKSSLYGFSYPKGSWLAIMKVDDDDIWNNYVKTGKVQGFSVDAMLELKEVNLKSEVNMSKSILDTLRKINAKLGITEPNEAEAVETKATEDVEVKAEEVKMGMVKSNDGIDFEYEGENLEAGVAIWANTEDGQRVALPVGEYPIEGDAVIIVSEEGIVAEVKEAMVEEETEEAAMSEGSTEGTNPLKDIAEVKSLLIKYAEENSKHREETEKQINELKEKLVEFSSQPAAKPVRQIEQVQLTSKGRILNKLRK